MNGYCCHALLGASGVAHCPRMPVHGPRDPRDPEPGGLPITHLSTQTFVATLLLPSTPNGSLGREDPVSDDRPRYTPSLTLHSSPSRFFHHCTSIHHTQPIPDLDQYSCLVCLSHPLSIQQTLGDCTINCPYCRLNLSGSVLVTTPPADYIASNTTYPQDTFASYSSTLPVPHHVGL